jgi:threonine synthase
MKCCDATQNPKFPFADIREGSRIICTVTGHGLKDPEIAAPASGNMKTVAADADAVLRAIDF